MTALPADREHEDPPARPRGSNAAPQPTAGTGEYARRKQRPVRSYAMPADYAALEARVAELEQQMRHILPAKVDAISYGLSVLHTEVRERLDDQGERLDRIELSLDQHGEMLAEILRRLPEAEPDTQ
jgi:hypothetical protein